MVSARTRLDARAGRVRALVAIFAVAFLLIALRLVWIQVVEAPALAERARSQRMRDVEVAPRRGTIYDREGEPLAVSVEAKTIYVSPPQVRDSEHAAQALCAVLGGKKKTYLDKLNSSAGFVYIARKVDLEIARELEALDLDGVGFVDDFKRIYPGGDLGSQVLGFVGVDDQGLAGLEKHYDDILAGTPGVMMGERDPYGRPIPGGIQKVIPPEHGRDIILAIDKDVQQEAQSALAKAVKTWGAKSASAVVLDPRNGEILAMASAPGFDANTYGQADADEIRNRPLTDAYEPGSTLKCLTAAAVIEKGLYTPKSKFNLPPTISVGGRTIKEAHGRPAVRWTLSEIVMNSSNVGTVKLGLKLGEKGLYESFEDFGLTETPGTDFPGTTKGWLPPTSQWSASSIGNIPFGQGVSVTPVQLARAIGAIANDGVMTTPHFLLSTPDESDVEPSWPNRRAISTETAQSLNGILVRAVTEGTGSQAAIDGYTVAGKTGTAQKPLPGGGGYKGGGYVGSFIGYLPAEDPRLLICVTVDQPTRAIYGGVVAGPAFAHIGEFAATHLKIEPSPPKKSKKRGKSASRGVDETPSVSPVSKPDSTD